MEGYAVRALRPLARRAETMARPARVRIRVRKPCLWARRRLLGWKVRLPLATVLTPCSSRAANFPGRVADRPEGPAATAGDDRGSLLRSDDPVGRVDRRSRVGRPPRPVAGRGSGGDLRWPMDGDGDAATLKDRWQSTWPDGENKIRHALVTNDNSVIPRRSGRARRMPTMLSPGLTCACGQLRHPRTLKHRLSRHRRRSRVYTQASASCPQRCSTLCTTVADELSTGVYNVVDTQTRGRSRMCTDR